LDTLYAGRPPFICAIEPPSLDTFTMRGRGEDRSSGSRVCVTRHAPNRLMSSASATGDRSVLPAIAHRSGGADALFTIASTRPYRSLTHCPSRWTLTELSTSMWHGVTRSPSGSISLAASWPRRGSLEPSTTA
jgi:hypothetical protein